MSHKQRLRQNRAKLGGFVPLVVMPSHYATEDEAFQPGTRKLKPGFYWGRGAEKGCIIRKA